MAEEDQNQEIKAENITAERYQQALGDMATASQGIIKDSFPESQKIITIVAENPDLKKRLDKEIKELQEEREEEEERRRQEENQQDQGNFVFQLIQVIAAIFAGESNPLKYLNLTNEQNIQPDNPDSQNLVEVNYDDLTDGEKQAAAQWLAENPPSYSQLTQSQNNQGLNNLQEAVLEGTSAEEIAEIFTNALENTHLMVAVTGEGGERTRKFVALKEMYEESGLQQKLANGSIDLMKTSALIEGIKEGNLPDGITNQDIEDTLGMSPKELKDILNDTTQLKPEQAEKIMENLPTLAEEVSNETAMDFMKNRVLKDVAQRLSEENLSWQALDNKAKELKKALERDDNPLTIEQLNQRLVNNQPLEEIETLKSEVSPQQDAPNPQKIGQNQTPNQQNQPAQGLVTDNTPLTNGNEVQLNQNQKKPVWVTRSTKYIEEKLTPDQLQAAIVAAKPAARLGLAPTGNMSNERLNNLRPPSTPGRESPAQQATVG